MKSVNINLCTSKYSCICLHVHYPPVFRTQTDACTPTDLHDQLMSTGDKSESIVVVEVL